MDKSIYVYRIKRTYQVSRQMWTERVEGEGLLQQVMCLLLSIFLGKLQI